MPKINPRISSLDDLLGVAREVENTAAAEDKPAQPGNNEIQMLSPEIIRGFRGHPFRLYEGERLNDLVERMVFWFLPLSERSNRTRMGLNTKCWPVITGRTPLLLRSAHFPVS